MIGLGMIKKTTIFSGLILLFALAVPLVPALVQAQGPQQRACDGVGGTWDASEGTCISGGQGASLDPIFKTVTNVLLFLVGAVSLIMIVVGGFRYVISGGDSNQLAGAKNTVLYAIVGLVISIMAYAIVNFVLDQL